MATATVTTEFRHEYEQERSGLLRRRFLWWAGVILAFSALSLLAALAALLFPDVAGTAGARLQLSALVRLGFSLATLSLFTWAALHVRSRQLTQQGVVTLAQRLIVVYGVLALAPNVLAYELQAPTAGTVRFSMDDAQPASSAADAAQDAVDASAAPQAPVQRVPSSFVAISALVSIFLTHFFACAFLPLSPRESLKPMAPLLLLAAVVTLVYARGFWTPALVIALSPLTAAPGALIAWRRHGAFRRRFHLSVLRDRYGQMKRELTDARRIHEALFPAPLRTGPVRFDYRYEPMRQIGGDFLFAHRFAGVVDDPDVAAEPVSLVLIDVTGHGIPAALTVNRLHGELERLFAEEPDITPGQTLEALNRYVNLTLATHSVYATALCLRADPTRQTLAYASGGHPPAFLRTVDGRLEQLDSTAFVLGACSDEDFEPGERVVPFGLGDTLVAYTDGAIEARDRQGRMLGVEGLRAIVLGLAASDQAGLCQAVLDAVNRHREGPLLDDTLIVALYRPLRS